MPPPDCGRAAAPPRIVAASQRPRGSRRFPRGPRCSRQRVASSRPSTSPTPADRSVSRTVRVPVLGMATKTAKGFDDARPRRPSSKSAASASLSRAQARNAAAWRASASLGMAASAQSRTKSGKSARASTFSATSRRFAYLVKYASCAASSSGTHPASNASQTRNVSADSKPAGAGHRAAALVTSDAVAALQTSSRQDRPVVDLAVAWTSPRGTASPSARSFSRRGGLRGNATSTFRQGFGGTVQKTRSRCTKKAPRRLGPGGGRASPPKNHARGRVDAGVVVGASRRWPDA